MSSERDDVAEVLANIEQASKMRHAAIERLQGEIKDRRAQLERLGYQEIAGNRVFASGSGNVVVDARHDTKPKSGRQMVKDMVARAKVASGKPCGTCGDMGHDKRRHRWDAKAGKAVATGRGRKR